MSIDCYCDYDPADVYSARVVKARKHYRCDECAGRINPGASYEYTFGVWGGATAAYRTCMSCVGIRRFVKINIPCFCWAHGNLIEDCRDTIDMAYDQAADEVRGLRFGFGRMLVAARRQRTELSLGLSQSKPPVKS